MESLRGKIICIEGPIGIGKSTLGKSLEQYLNSNGIEAIFYTEPFNQKMLEQFLSDQPKYAYAFQLYMLTRRQVVFVQAIHQAQMGKTCIIDRSLIGDLVFANLQNIYNNMTDEDFGVYREIYDQFKEYNPDIIIYLNSSIEKQLERIRIRNRNKEDTYQLDYLNDLNKIYLKTLKEEFDLPNRKVQIIEWGENVLVQDGLLDSETTKNMIDRIESHL